MIWRKSLLALSVTAALALTGCSGEAGTDTTTPVEVDTDNLERDSGGEVGADAGEESDSDPNIAGDSTVDLDGTIYEYNVMCAREPGEVELAMSGISATGPLNAGFEVADDPADSIAVVIDGEAWRVDSDGDTGEFQSLDVDIDAGTAQGLATFESESGASVEGTFDLTCIAFG